jgi:stage II sporulation protein M
MNFWKAKRLMYIKLFAVIFLGCFVIGIIVANIFSKQYMNQTGILSEYFIMKYKYMDFNHNQLFLFILQKRLKWVILLWGLGFTMIGVPVIWGYCGWLGFSAGMLLSLSVMRLGFTGVVICFLGLIPQIFLYIPGILLLLNQAYAMSLFHYEGRGLRQSYKRGRSQTTSAYITLLCIVLMIIIIGNFLESYVNPNIIGNLLKKF